MRIPTRRSGASGQRQRQRQRSGTTIVEAAFVLPVFFMIIFAIMVFGHSQMVANMADAACRRAARYGSTDGATTAEVIAKVENVMSAAVDTSNVSIIVKDAGVWDSGGTLPSTSADFLALPDVEVADLEPRDLFLVRVELKYKDVAIMYLPIIENLYTSAADPGDPSGPRTDAVIFGEAFTRHE